MSKIAIDAGHGKYTEGKRCLKSLDTNETREWVLNSRIATKVVSLLEQAGHEVKRLDDITGETDVSLSTRTSTANSWGANYCISIHHNAGINGGSGGGVICIVYPGVSGVTLKLQSEIYNAVIAQTSLKGNRSQPLTQQDLHMCRETKMPAVLIECGFMDSSTDVPIILTDEFANKCARGIAQGIVNVAGGNLPSETIQINDSAVSDSSSDTIYRVQVGAFKSRDNATKYVEKLKKIGIEAFIRAE